MNALQAHGANVNARMTKPQPSIAGGFEETVWATPLLLAASADDLEMMQLLVKAGADPKIPTATKATAIMAATGLNHGIGESPVTEAEAMASASNSLLDHGARRSEGVSQKDRVKTPCSVRLPRLESCSA